VTDTLRVLFSGFLFAEDDAKTGSGKQHFRQSSRYRRLCLLMAGVLAILSPAYAQAGAGLEFRNTARSVRYVGSAACSVPGCHAEIDQAYAHSPHGLSTTVANAAAHLERAAHPVTVHNPKNNRYYTVYAANGDLYQSVYELDERGHRRYEAIHKIDYATGGERTGYTYMFRVGGWIFQAPLSYYVSSGTWELSPGYAADDVGFTRVMTTGCLVCHNGQPDPEPRRDGMYKAVPFRFGELGISCEACHGPGELHVREMQGQRGRVLKPGEVDTSIVNPAKLDPQLANDICRECHQAGDAAVQNPGTSVLDFRPGEPLSATINLVRRPIAEKDRMEANRLETAPPVRGSLEQPLWWKNSTMELSRCYTASRGKLTCLTCHSEHRGSKPGEERTAYRAACLSCHTATSCRLKPVDPQRTAVNDYCIECHMEKRAVAGIAHSNDTKHRIVLYPGQPLPESAFEQPQADLPGLLWMNRPEGGGTMPERVQMEAYWSVARKDASLWPLWLQKLKTLSRATPDDPLVLEYEGALALGMQKDYTRAAEKFRAALKAGMSSPELYLDLANAEEKMGQAQPAEEALEEGVAVYPYNGSLRAELGLVLAANNEQWRGQAVLREHLKLFPEDARCREALGQIEAASAPRPPVQVRAY